MNLFTENACGLRVRFILDINVIDVEIANIPGLRDKQSDAKISRINCGKLFSKRKIITSVLNLQTKSQHYCPKIE